ncbi:DEP domain-containing protein 4 [Bombina bombina]|uniref:DEP domain-containing protein 4 n=1 Tax=Bombina bombina TaxID=8345 RepID=UPI00235ABF9C|nr:DEP domain-containing protein 4 [Bombina bombina]
MAADLTPRFRRIRSVGELRTHRRKKAFTGPFQATQLWNSIIEALKSQVEVKNRRQHLRTYANCFTGSDAVDVVLCHLMQNMYLSSLDISRTKGVHLCQALMDHKVFEPVSMKLFKTENEQIFEDSGNHFYRFLQSSVTIDFIPDEKNTELRRLSRSGCSSTICNPSALGSQDEKLTKLLKGICDHPNAQQDVELCKTRTISQKDIENLWKQQIMLRLLQLIHIPFLEDILESPAKTEQRKHFSDLIVSNTFLDREVLQMLSLPKLDRWLAAAVECLEYFPDQQIVMLSQQLPQSYSQDEDLHLCKKMLFEVIAKYYAQERDPFLDNKHLTILTGIVELLDSGRKAHGLEAVQLYLRLLVPKAREELRRLLTFLAIASEADGYKLQKQFVNKIVVIKTFTKVVIHSPSISKAQSEEFALFLLENYCELFKTPLPLLDLISTKLRSLQNGIDPDAISGFTFCQRLTLKEYESQRYYYTIGELKHLIKILQISSSLPEKKKKKLMKEFQKYHPAATN